MTVPSEASDGLTSSEAAERLRNVGPNVIAEKHVSLLERLGVYFWGPFLG